MREVIKPEMIKRGRLPALSTRPRETERQTLVKKVSDKLQIPVTRSDTKQGFKPSLELDEIIGYL